MLCKRYSTFSAQRNQFCMIRLLQASCSVGMVNTGCLNGSKRDVVACSNGSQGLAWSVWGFE